MLSSPLELLWNNVYLKMRITASFHLWEDYVKLSQKFSNLLANLYNFFWNFTSSHNIYPIFFFKVIFQ